MNLSKLFAVLSTFAFCSARFPFRRETVIVYDLDLGSQCGLRLRLPTPEEQVDLARNPLIAFTRRVLHTTKVILRAQRQ
jgi:hypothetical protein